jgi:hypothetical protein
MSPSTKARTILAARSSRPCRCGDPAHMAPNFSRLDTDRLLMIAMLQARDAFTRTRRSWSHPLEHTAEERWADVLADPRARRQAPVSHGNGAFRTYRLSDEPQATILVACGKCDWRAAFGRDELIAEHGADYPMPNLLGLIAAPGCSKVGASWDRCGAHYLEPIDGAR